MQNHLKLDLSSFYQEVILMTYNDNTSFLIKFKQDDKKIMCTFFERAK